ncbi:MAG TPA: CoA activase [Candidatus Latescibacteria bacterium]|nr:CoA activase [Candidatus Latescibacterota bacterium]
MNKGGEAIYLGIDIGSVSVNTVLIDQDSNVLEDHYTRTHGQPVQTVIAVLKGIFNRVSPERIAGVATTGSGGRLVARLLGGQFVNEIIAQAKAVGELYPEVRTVIEMGGEDSKLLLLERDGSSGKSRLEDFSTSSACAAGTGSFLDQQASRLELSIEEFGRLALKSKNPPRIAGRCSVFAKSDMIHLQQIATPDYDIVAGLCYAVARNFKSNIGRGKSFKKPIAFQGGVAANIGVVKAFEDLLELERGELIIPKHYASMGAIGAVLICLEKGFGEIKEFKGLDELESYLGSDRRDSRSYVPLGCDGKDRRIDVRCPVVECNGATEAFLGVDVGSLSTNLVVIDGDKRVLARRYLWTAGRPIEAVRRGLKEIGEEIGDKVRILGVGTTGSGRYMTGDFIGADVVRNEITAQATAALHIDPDVDTIFEIGGQDSKYISLDKGAVVDFEMNKVCAAGTGSFLEEQADKLNVSIIEEFGDLALKAQCPARLGERCTVFMESDLFAHQQEGWPKESLVAGLCYSIVYNYLNRVVGDKRVGDNIFFQGGVAWNKGVVAAFEKVLGKTVTVPPHHDVTGAIGAAILAMEAYDGKKSNFKGFDLSQRNYRVTTFVCNGCDNQCNIKRVKVEAERPLFYGARCERYEVDKGKIKGDGIPDLFAEREKLLLASYQEPVDNGKERIGIPRILYFYELFPYWNAFFTELGFQVVLSEPTSQKTIHRSVETIAAESCLPIEISHGHVLSLLDKGVEYIFLPSIINMKPNNPGFTQTYNCPLIQSVPYIIKSALIIEDGLLLDLPIHFGRGEECVRRELIELGRRLGKSAKDVKRAMCAASEEQQRFYEKAKARGRGVLNELGGGQKAAVIISRPYNGADRGINLDLPKKLRDMGVIAIPLDVLPLEDVDVSEEFPNMYWNYGQKILSAVEIIRKIRHLNAIYISNFRCGPDSFISHLVKEKMGSKPYLQLEVDEHSADAGVITRCEAFFDSLESIERRRTIKRKLVNKCHGFS